VKEHREGKGRGFWGTVLHVDLDKRQTHLEELPQSLYANYLSGVGLGAKVLWDRMKPGAEPMGPDNILGFTSGLLTDTGTLFTGRFMVLAKSPLSKGWGDANCGGYFSPALKRCGVDAVFFHGCSPEPVYLFMDHETAELQDASDLWGLDTLETEQKLKARHGKRAQIACIGSAGERRSLMAGIAHDGGRMAARSGLGAVMGSKKLKAVVAAGNQRVAVADRTAVRALSRAFVKQLDRLRFLEPYLGDMVFGLTGRITRGGVLYPRQPSELWRLMLRKFGTPAITALSAESGDSPIKNWKGIGYKDFPLKRSQQIGAGAVTRYEKKKYGCYSCPLRCGGIVSVTDGPQPIEEMHKPEYETLCAFGSLLLNNDLHSIFTVNDLLNRAGMDSISCGGTVAFAIECFENHILEKKDTDGLELRWGNGEAVVQLVKMIIRREGLGDLLADGVKRAAERIGSGSEKYAVHCGGVEAPMHDPKFDPGFLLAYVCDATPGRHTTASYQYLDLQHLEDLFSRANKVRSITTRRERFRYTDKAESLAVDCFYKMLMDGAGACLFGTQVGGPLPLCAWMNAATGWNLSNDDYLAVGERIYQLRHAFNVREGLNPIRDFRPHPRIYGARPFLKGPARQVTLDVDRLARSYYQTMHWDPETGKPALEHVRNLGLYEVAEAFYRDKGA
jgi:aldehyde:ferredoxin oxidoreductase